MRRASIITGIVLFLCAFPVVLYAHSLTFTAGMDNFAYDPGDLDSADRFKLPTQTVLFNAGIEGEFLTFSRYQVRFENDTILRYLASGSTIFNLWIFRLGAGGFVSLFSGGEKPYVPGVSGSLGIEIPGRILAYVEYGQSAFTDLTEPGNINLDYGKLETSLWLPFVVCRASAERKSFTSIPADTYTIRNSLLRYQAAVDFFSKSSPFQITFGVGQETLEKLIESIPHTGSSVFSLQEETSRVFAFCHLACKLNPRLEFLLNAEMTISTTATESIFKTVAGFRIEIPDS
jgi:hypothetical protein